MKVSFPALRSESDLLLRLDSLRFVAAAMVVVYHFRNQWMFPSGPGWFASRFDILSLAVDLFFIISGIVITFVYGERLDYGAFIKRRFARLAPLHYATLLFYLLAGFIAFRAGYDSFEMVKYRPECAPSHVLFLQAHGMCAERSFNDVSWSIGAEMTVYVAFPLFLRLLGLHRALPALVGLACIAMLDLAAPWSPGNEAWRMLTHDWGVVRAVPAFLFGMSLWAYRKELARVPHADGILLMCIALFVAGALMEADIKLMYALTYAIAAAALAADLSGGRRRLPVLIAPLGTLTFGIYMLHPVIRSVGFPLLVHGGVDQNLAIAICGLLVMPLAYASYVWFENPMRRWLARQQFPLCAATA